ncbi:MAG: hypothetical protein QXU40_03255 [Candidatus Pacearchaeota archaeon]
MADIFDNVVFCGKCNVKMERKDFERNGFILRSLVCPKCEERVIHPVDKQKYNKFINLKNKEFRVKMRLVGNSYAVSIPKEIVSFMEEQEKIINYAVRLCFENFGKLSLIFDRINNKRG